MRWGLVCFAKVWEGWKPWGLGCVWVRGMGSLCMVVVEVEAAVGLKPEGHIALIGVEDMSCTLCCCFILHLLQ